MSRERTNPHTADATAFGRAWTAIRALPGVLQAALMVLVLLLVASPFVIAAAITSLTSSPGDAVGAGEQTADLSFDEANDEVSWRVVNVVDGDTLDARGIDGTEERVRVIGIDTPERGECGYAAATDALAELVLGEEVMLRAGARDDRDVHGRLLRYVDREVAVADPAVADPAFGPTKRRIDAGLVLLERGLAVARYDSRDGYGGHPREAAYVAADDAAEHPGCGA